MQNRPQGIIWTTYDPGLNAFMIDNLVGIGIRSRCRTVKLSLKGSVLASVKLWFRQIYSNSGWLHDTNMRPYNGFVSVLIMTCRLASFGSWIKPQRRMLEKSLISDVTNRRKDFENMLCYIPAFLSLNSLFSKCPVWSEPDVLSRL